MGWLLKKGRKWREFSFPCGNFSFGGEEGIVFVAPGLLVDEVVLGIKRTGPPLAKAEGRGQVGFELVIWSHIPSFAVSSEVSRPLCWVLIRILIFYIFLFCVLCILVIRCQDGFSNTFGCFSQGFGWILGFPYLKTFSNSSFQVQTPIQSLPWSGSNQPSPSTIPTIHPCTPTSLNLSLHSCYMFPSLLCSTPTLAESSLASSKCHLPVFCGTFLALHAGPGPTTPSLSSQAARDTSLHSSPDFIIYCSAHVYVSASCTSYSAPWAEDGLLYPHAALPCVCGLSSVLNTYIFQPLWKLKVNILKIALEGLPWWYSG